MSHVLLHMHSLMHVFRTCITFSVINTLLQSGSFATADEPALTHHHRLRSTVNLRAHSWWCIVYGFGQRYDDMYPSL